MERIKGELTVCITYTIILRGNRIVIPEEMQQQVVVLAHEGHQGVVKTKALLGEKVWFVYINDLTEHKVNLDFQPACLSRAEADTCDELDAWDAPPARRL